MGEVYGLPRHLFDEETIDRVGRAARRAGEVDRGRGAGMASVYRGRRACRCRRRCRWRRGDAPRSSATCSREFMPFDLVIDEQTADGRGGARLEDERVRQSGARSPASCGTSPTSSASRARRSKGRSSRCDLMRRYADRRRGDARVRCRRRKRDALVLTRRVDVLTASSWSARSRRSTSFRRARGRRRAGAGRALARGEARHPAVRRNRRAIDEMRELYRRSGGTTPRLSSPTWPTRYEEQLADVDSMEEFRAAPLEARPRGRWSSPGGARTAARAAVRGGDPRESGSTSSTTSKTERRRSGRSTPTAIARLRLPEKLARTLVEEELPVLDRPLRFVVMRGPAGAVRAASLGELQALLDRPWSPDEPVEVRPRRRDARPRRRQASAKHGDRREPRGRRGDRKRRRRR